MAAVSGPRVLQHNLLLLPVAHPPPNRPPQRSHRQRRLSAGQVSAAQPARATTALAQPSGDGLPRTAAEAGLLNGRLQMSARKKCGHPRFPRARRSPPVTSIGLPYVGRNDDVQTEQHLQMSPRGRVPVQGSNGACEPLWAWKKDALSAMFDKAREEAVLMRRRKALREGRAAAAAQAWEQSITLLSGGLDAKSPAGDDTLVAELRATLNVAELAREARDAARLEASRISLTAQLAQQHRRYEEAVTAWRAMLSLDIQDSGWLTDIRRDLARAEGFLSAQTTARSQVAKHCESAFAAMAAGRYVVAVAEYEAAQQYDARVNDVGLQTQVMNGLKEAVTAVEMRNAACDTARKQLDTACRLARSQSWEHAIEACCVGLAAESEFQDEALKQKMQEQLASCRGALHARDEARCQAAECEEKANAFFEADDYSAAAAMYQAAANFDTQDADLTRRLTTRVHLSLASHELSEGRTCMASSCWESGIVCFQRGLKHGSDMSGDGGGVMAELRECLSSCEARVAARDDARAFAAIQCRNGKEASQSRDYSTAIAAFKAASEADVQDERLIAELDATLEAAQAAYDDLEAARTAARRLASDAVGAFKLGQSKKAIELYNEALLLEIYDDDETAKLRSGLDHSMRMLDQQQAAISRASKRYEAAQVHLAAQAWEDAIAMLDTGLQELRVYTAGSQADDALLCNLSEALQRASTALRERDMARSEAQRLELLAREAANSRQYEDMLQAYKAAAVLDLQDSDWTTCLEEQRSHAAELLAAQAAGRAIAASLHVKGLDAMDLRHYEQAVLHFKAAVSHDVNDATLDGKYRGDLHRAVAMLEQRNAARTSAQHQLLRAEELALADHWEQACTACTAALNQEDIFEDACLSVQLVVSTLVSETALHARDEARCQAAECEEKANAFFEADDYSAAAAMYQAAANFDTQDADLTRRLTTRVHLSLASHELSEGRTCMASSCWESGIVCFQRGLKHGSDMSGDGGGVMAELRECLSSCEARVAARQVSEMFSQQLVQTSVYHTLTQENRQAAEQLCRDGHTHMQRRDYAAAIHAYEAAVALDVDDEHLAQSFRDALGAAFPRPQLSELEIARLRFVQASAAAHCALDSATQAGGEVVTGTQDAQLQDVQVTLELQGQDLPKDEAAAEELKRQFVTEMAEALGVAPEMFENVELMSSREEHTRTLAQEWLAQLLTRSIRDASMALDEKRTNQQQDAEARSVASLLAESDAIAACETSSPEGTSKATKRSMKVQAKEGISALFRSAVGKVSATTKEKRAKKKKKKNSSKKKKNIEERLHLRTVRALVALEDPATMHSMLIDKRGSDWCDSGLCLWCKRPHDDPLRALCPSTDETVALKQLGTP